MIVFPESMNTVQKGDPAAAMQTVERYINYMCQRVEWAMGNVGKTVTAAGVSSAETYTLLMTLQNTVSALQSTVNSHGASISSILQTVTMQGNDLLDVTGRVETLEESAKALKQEITEMKENLSAVQDGLAAVQSSLQELSARVTDTETRCSSLEGRVTALENSGQEGT